jgi:hypothetical protein
MMSDHQLLSDLLHELDDVIGCGQRSWIQDMRVHGTRLYTTDSAITLL